MKEVLTDMNVKTRLGSHDTRYANRPSMTVAGTTKHEKSQNVALYFQ